MTRSILLHQSSPVDGRAEEYEDWYEQVHLPDMLRVPGFAAAQRYAIDPVQRAGAPAPVHPFVTIYTLDAPVGDALAALELARGSMHVSDALRRDVIAHVFSPR
jgi:hypothetical protein